jgi:hypothetical protein
MTRVVQLFTWTAGAATARGAAENDAAVAQDKTANASADSRILLRMSEIYPAPRPREWKAGSFQGFESE